MQLTAAPEKPPRDLLKIGGASPFSGASVVNISPATIEDYSIANAHEGANAVLRVIDALDDHDDVQEVYANFDITDEILDALG